MLFCILNRIALRSPYSILGFLLHVFPHSSKFFPQPAPRPKTHRFNYNSDPTSLVAVFCMNSLLCHCDQNTWENNLKRNDLLWFTVSEGHSFMEVRVSMQRSLYYGRPKSLREYKNKSGKTQLPNRHRLTHSLVRLCFLLSFLTTNKGLIPVNNMSVSHDPAVFGNVLTDILKWPLLILVIYRLLNPPVVC